MKTPKAMTRYEFQQMAVALRPTIVARCVRILSDDDLAEDIAQDTLLKLWSMGGELERFKSKESLALTIARNLCLDRLRSPASRGVALDGVMNLNSGAPSPERVVEERESVSAVIQAMNSLPDSVRTIMNMRHVEGMETEEIAAMIGSSVESVRVSLSRGRKRLKEIFENRLFYE